MHSHTGPRKSVPECLPGWLARHRDVRRWKFPLRGYEGMMLNKYVKMIISSAITFTSTSRLSLETTRMHVRMRKSQEHDSRANSTMSNALYTLSCRPGNGYAGRESQQMQCVGDNANGVVCGVPPSQHPQPNIYFT